MTGMTTASALATVLFLGVGIAHADDMKPKESMEGMSDTMEMKDDAMMKTDEMAEDAMDMKDEMAEEAMDMEDEMKKDDMSDG